MASELLQLLLSEQSCQTQLCLMLAIQVSVGSAVATLLVGRNRNRKIQKKQLTKAEAWLLCSQWQAVATVLFVQAFCSQLSWES